MHYRYTKIKEPCMCGADDCPRCYPNRRRRGGASFAKDEDEAYDRWQAKRDNEDKPEPEPGLTFKRTI